MAERLSDNFPDQITLTAYKVEFNLRYGENPHQKAAFYRFPGSNAPMVHLQNLGLKDPGYINITDMAAGVESVRIFEEPAAVVIKHNSPSGIALGDSLPQAVTRAIESDPVSAFGGILVANKRLDVDTAQALVDFKESARVQMDIVAAPDVTEAAIDLIGQTRKKENIGIYSFGDIPTERTDPNHYRFIDGGILIQDWDDDHDRSLADWKIVTDVQPTKEQLLQMDIAWKFIGRIKSNTVIVVDKDIPMTRGIGAGQTSRVGSTEIALNQAGEYVRGGILASDSFFPFDDCVKMAADYGIGAILQQGGSSQDKASIAAANAAGIPMVFTGERKFWH